MNRDLKFLVKTVKSASKLIKDDFEVNAKDDKGDLVTTFDYSVEQFIISKIKKEYPSFDIVSEEYNSNKELTDNCFTIDPIDGTINFANHLPLWSIQVSCIREGKVVAAVIYLPKLRELYTADEQGAYLNGKAIHVNKDSLDRGIYVIDGPQSSMYESIMREVANNYRSFYCASFAFSSIAAGRVSASMITKDNPWDYVPGQYIVEKAGGVIYNDKGMHAAANGKIFLEAMLKAKEKVGWEK